MIQTCGTSRSCIFFWLPSSHSLLNVYISNCLCHSFLSLIFASAEFEAKEGPHYIRKVSLVTLSALLKRE